MIKQAIRVGIGRSQSWGTPPQVIVLSGPAGARQYTAYPIPWEDWADMPISDHSTWPRRRVKLP